MIVRHTENQINEAASRFRKLTDELDLATAEVDKLDDLREVAVESEAVHTDEV